MAAHEIDKREEVKRQAGQKPGGVQSW